MGHVFVVHGDLLKISADAILIPCDRSGDVGAHWAPFGPAADRTALAREMGASRVSTARSHLGFTVRYVDTGATKATANAGWLGTGIRAGLDAAIADVLSAGTPDHGRARPLVAMPVFGVGDGGFDAIRGQALRAQLSAAAAGVANVDVDVAIICFQRADFAALQLQRSPSDWELTDDLRDAGDSLAAAVKAERLVLFLGAGVSVAAGIGDFESLVSLLEERSGATRGPSGLPERVASLEAANDARWIEDNVTELIRRDRYSLTHGLLASLRVREAITTNFDDLYEMSCARPFADVATEGTSSVEVLPWERSATQRPWLLKAHGDPARSGGLVLSADSFATFETDRPSVAGVVRAMFALSREVLFVGYSLTDKNIKKLVDEAVRFHDGFGVRHPRLGTIVDLTSTTLEPAENPARLGTRDSPDEPISNAARRLQILLDYIAWQSSRHEAAWLLDRRYEALLSDDSEREAARRLSDDALPAGDAWSQLDTGLRRFGRRAKG